MDETMEVPTSQESIKTTAEEKPATEPTGTESQEFMKPEHIPEEKQTIEEKKSSHESKDSQQTTDDVITSAEPEVTEAPVADAVDALAAEVIGKGDEVKEKVEESKDPQQEQTGTDVKNENAQPVECKEVSAKNQDSKDELQQPEVEAKEEREEPHQEQVATETKKEIEEPKAVECEEVSPESKMDSSVSKQPGSTNTEPEVLHQETVQIEHQPEKIDVTIPPENMKPEETISTTHASEIPTTLIVSSTPDVPATSETVDEKPVAPLPVDTLAKPAGESKRRGSIEKMSNFLRQFRSSGGFKKFTASQFMKVWNHYDSDGNCH